MHVEAKNVLVGGTSWVDVPADTQALHADVEAGSPTGSTPQSELEFIHANLDRNIHLEDLARAAGFSSFHFAKLFKASTGSSPHQYLL